MGTSWFCNPSLEVTRRAFLGSAGLGLGALALGGLEARDPLTTTRATLPHFAPRARRVIYLFQSGGPSQVDLLDWKPNLRALHGTELPPSVRHGQRLTGMTSGQATLPIAASRYDFTRCGQSGIPVSSLLPYTQRVADELCVINTMHTEAINHDPAITFINTGSQQIGKASLGSWLSYGLGSDNEDLPAYVVLLSQGTGKAPGQPIFSRLWGSGFLPSSHQGVKLRSGKDPVLFLSNPPGIARENRRALLDDVRAMNEMRARVTGDPEIETRIRQYELAYRMQASVPELTDLSTEPESTFGLYGEEARRPGSYAANCLLARRMAERGVRFIQLFHRGWDQHLNLDKELRAQCRDTDQASAALIEDLRQRGLLEDTLVVFGGEFGRTVYSQGRLDAPGSGRDHHGRNFSVWLAGGGIKGGYVHGETDEFSYNVAKDPVHIRDLNATLLHCLGIDHDRLTFGVQGLAEKPTGVEEAFVVDALLA